MYEVITTDRLVLRPLSGEDTRDFAKLVANWDICRMTGTFPYPFPKPSVEGLIDIFLARAETGYAMHWAVLFSGQFAGAIGIYRTETGWNLGYWLGQPFWGQGLATEMVRGLVSHIVAVNPEACLSADVFTDNPASSHILQKAGFKKVETVSEGYSLARRKSVPTWQFIYNADVKADMTDRALQQGQNRQKVVCEA